jgi:hypothetical protein
MQATEEGEEGEEARMSSMDWKKERRTMYFVKVKVSGRLSELLTRDGGRVVHTPKGDVCAFRSLAEAERAAKLLAEYGLLG